MKSKLRDIEVYCSQCGLILKGEWYRIYDGKDYKYFCCVQHLNDWEKEQIEKTKNGRFDETV